MAESTRSEFQREPVKEGSKLQKCNFYFNFFPRVDHDLHISKVDDREPSHEDSLMYQ